MELVSPSATRLLFSRCMTSDDVSYVYKYLPYDDGSLRVIRDGTVKFTSPLDFNDPFDCRPFFDPAAVERIWRARPDLIKAAAAAQGLSPAQRLQKKDWMLTNIRRDIESGNFAKSLIRDIGVCCLSRTATDILMWSHYAGFHRGLVIEFAVPRTGSRADMATLLISLPVRYSSKRPRIDLSEGIDSFEQLERSLLTKAEQWRYEQEERVIVPGRPPGIYAYDRDRQLISVVAGMSMPSNDFARLRAEVAALNNVQLYQAREVRDEYRIHVPGHPRLA
jgi:hypothetical protein